MTAQFRFKGDKMKKFPTFLFFVVLVLAILANFAKADQKEANLYMREQKLVFGDEYCTKALQRYVFADCRYIDYKKGEILKSSNQSIGGDLHFEKCKKLLSERIKCVRKHEKDAK